jgi:hypothetical protein
MDKLGLAQLHSCNHSTNTRPPGEHHCSLTHTNTPPAKPWHWIPEAQDPSQEEKAKKPVANPGGEGQQQVAIPGGEGQAARS